MGKDIKLCYVWDELLIEESDRLPAVKGRASMVHDLIESYGLLKHMKIVRSSPASFLDLKEFHSELYLEHLKTITDVDEDYTCTAQDEEYGLAYDCEPVSNLYNLVSTIAGGTVTAAKCLLLGLADVVINWCGGWHHAQRFGADGFCYVNDIVIGIEKLKKKFPKILYIDLDVHHGNGVEDAFNISKSVFTLSFHKSEPGFYPGTGTLHDIGNLTGKGYCCNVPLHAWYSDDTMEYVFDKVFNAVFGHFGPDALVVQCGADALALDPHGGARLSAKGYSYCVKSVIRKRLPTMLLGGGGYNKANAARLWTTVTALLANVVLDENIPEHSGWTKYGPDYTINIDTGLNKRDANSTDYLDECIRVIKHNLKTYLPLKDFDGPDLKRLKIEDAEADVNSQRNSFKTKNCDIGASLQSKAKNVDVYAFDE